MVQRAAWHEAAAQTRGLPVRPAEAAGFEHPPPAGAGGSAHPPPARGDASCWFPPSKDSQSPPLSCIRSLRAAHAGRVKSLRLHRMTLGDRAVGRPARLGTDRVMSGGELRVMVTSALLGTLQMEAHDKRRHLPDPFCLTIVTGGYAVDSSRLGSVGRMHQSQPCGGPLAPLRVDHGCQRLPRAPPREARG